MRTKFFILSILLLMLLNNPVQSLPLALQNNDALDDVQLREADHAGFTEGQNITSADELDITQISYTYTASGVLETVLTLVGAPSLNSSTRYDMKLVINRYPDTTTSPVSVTINTVTDAGTPSISMSYELVNGTQDSVNVPIVETTTATSISWSYNISTFLPVGDIFDVNTTRVLVQGSAEYYPGATTGDTNAVYLDEVSLEWPEIPDDVSDEDKNDFPVPFNPFGLLFLPVVVILRKKFN